jgi:hypothetical protein
METEFTMMPAMPASQGGLSTLTIEGGVTMLFERNETGFWRLLLGASSGPEPENLWPVRLRAEATPDAPIVLTSAEATPAAGDWGGIAWGGGPPDGNVMTNVRIEYAGADSGTQGFGCGESDNDAALIITNWRPADAFITSSTISDSAAGGIVSGWSTDLGGPNLGAGNTFTNIANGCNVSQWANGDGSCPGTPPLCL